MVGSSCKGLSPLVELRNRAELAEKCYQYFLAALLWKRLADETDDREEGLEALARAEAARGRSIYK